MPDFFLAYQKNGQCNQRNQGVIDSEYYIASKHVHGFKTARELGGDVLTHTGSHQNKNIAQLMVTATFFDDVIANRDNWELVGIS